MSPLAASKLRNRVLGPVWKAAGGVTPPGAYWVHSWMETTSSLVFKLTELLKWNSEGNLVASLYDK
jgi:hypothetical protein